jgi:hypothetical protein
MASTRLSWKRKAAGAALPENFALGAEPAGLDPNSRIEVGIKVLLAAKGFRSDLVFLG